MNIKFVEKCLKMPYCTKLGYFDLINRRVNCSINEDGDCYFDSKDKEFIENNRDLLKVENYHEIPRTVKNDSELILGNKTLACSVLNDGRRVIRDTSLFSAIDRSRKGEERIAGYPPILGSKMMVEMLHKVYPDPLDQQILFPFEAADYSGRVTKWYDANAIPMLCDLYMEAEDLGLITKGQEHILKQTKILMRSFARVGIIALIDEATGYQDERRKDELQILLDRFISEELQNYSRQFPQEYFKQLFRLYNKPYDPTTNKRPRYFSQFNIKYVYEMLPPHVWEKLDEINPTIYNEKKGRRDRKNKVYRHLTEDGIQWLGQHIHALIPIMKLSGDINEFKNNFDIAFEDKKKRIEELKSNQKQLELDL